MPDGSALWRLAGFEFHLDVWIELEKPDQDLINDVLAWLIARADDPYQGVAREPGFDNLWHGRIPGTSRAGATVVCSYFIVEREHVVRCNAIATLNWPA